ncbi:MAG: TetR/AcrR family transcriptional regulator [Hyphomonadaceae bacterium]
MSTPVLSTRERLVRAATSIAAREGLAAATTAAIADRAGVAEGTLYRHFPSKDELLIAAYRDMKNRVFIQAAEGVDTSLPPPDRLKRMWRAIYDAYREDPDAFLFGMRFAESGLEKKEGGEAARAIGKMVTDLRRDGVASGDFRKLPADLLGNLFLAPISSLLKSELKGRRWTDAELNAAAEAVLAGWRSQD